VVKGPCDWALRAQFPTTAKKAIRSCNSEKQGKKKMEKRIELERRGKAPHEIEELNLDNTRGSTEIEGLTEEYTALHTLSLIKIGLTSLEGFPKLPNLTKLELEENRISNGLVVLKGCPKLSHLNLTNNKIKDLEALEPLKSFDSLTHLDLLDNEICESEDYRSKVFKMLPNLKYLDNADADGAEAEDSDDEDDGVDANGDAGESDEDDDEEDGDEEETEESSDEEEEDGPGLAAIYNNVLDDDEDGEDYNEEGEEEDDEDIDEEEESEEPSHKRAKVGHSSQESNGGAPDSGGTAAD